MLRGQGREVLGLVRFLHAEGIFQPAGHHLTLLQVHQLNILLFLHFLNKPFLLFLLFDGESELFVFVVGNGPISDLPKEVHTFVDIFFLIFDLLVELLLVFSLF